MDNQTHPHPRDPQVSRDPHDPRGPQDSRDPHDPHDPRDTNLVLDCDTCAERHTSTCDDCVVTFLLRRRPGDAVVIDLDEHRSLRLLADAGLAPPLRHVPDS